MKSKKNTVSVTLIKSPCGRVPGHKETLTGLGLRRINQKAVLENTPCVQGMIKKVSYMLAVEEKS